MQDQRSARRCCWLVLAAQSDLVHGAAVVRARMGHAELHNARRCVIHVSMRCCAKAVLAAELQRAHNLKNREHNETPINKINEVEIFFTANAIDR